MKYLKKFNEMSETEMKDFFKDIIDLDIIDDAKQIALEYIDLGYYLAYSVAYNQEVPSFPSFLVLLSMYSLHQLYLFALSNLQVPSKFCFWKTTTTCAKGGSLFSSAKDITCGARRWPMKFWTNRVTSVRTFT
jgi:hypothetical protein